MGDYKPKKINFSSFLFYKKENFVMIQIIVEYFNIIFGRRKVYKFLVYINDKEFNKNDKLVETFQIIEFSARRAYKEAVDVLRLKYPDKGFDVRMV
jgi:hypothetical protein